MIARIGAVALAAAFGGCAGAPPAKTYDLSAATATARPARHPQLAVAEFSAAAPLAGDRILVRVAPDRIAHLAGAQWSEDLPALVRRRLVQSFQNAGWLGAVTPAGGASAADVELVGEIRTFEIDAATKVATVDVSVQLVSAGSGRIRAAKLFDANAQAASTAPDDVAPALDRALGDDLRAIVSWTSGR
ncbi:MAG: membrane integrity-associated transporter subunit PqiC [Hyphomicrobiales bacterium]|nr:membrane integrity-associated transporter subunit PqiC [Hyphomicrobiales bacterium]